MTAADPRAEHALAGGNVSGAVRVGDTVRRTAGPWTPAVHALLTWVRGRGVTSLPAPLGVDEHGREVLSWTPGYVPGDPLPPWWWSPRTREQAGAMLRAVHDATVGFDLEGRTWRSPVRPPVEVVCLNDVSPDNMVFDGTDLVGLIDVDMASPGPRVWDLAYLAYRACGWCEDMPTPRDSTPRESTPRERLADLLTGYGTDLAPQPAAVLASMVVRLDDLAAWTDEHARATGRHELHEHAAMYRRDARRLRDEAERGEAARGEAVRDACPHDASPHDECPNDASVRDV